MKKVVLFDFHNTLATCDSWLELEIKTLPALVLGKLAENGSIESVTPAMLDKVTGIFQTLRQTVRENGVELSAVEGTQRTLAEMGIHPPFAELESAVEQLENACLRDVAMVEGSDRAIERLYTAGCRLGVVSSAGYPAFVEMALEQMGLRPYFSEIVTSAGEGIYKSDPRIFRRAVARLGAAPSQAVHIGDHAVYDVQSAKAAGLSAIWLVAHARHTAALHNQEWQASAHAGSGADAVVKSMDELYDAIADLA